MRRFVFKVTCGGGEGIRAAGIMSLLWMKKVRINIEISICDCFRLVLGFVKVS